MNVELKKKHDSVCIWICPCGLGRGIIGNLLQELFKSGGYDIPLVVCNTQEMGKGIRDVL